MDGGETLTGAFGEAVGVALREMAAVESALRDTRRQAVPRAAGVAALLRLSFTAGGVGDFVLDLPPVMAAEVARRVFAEVGTEPDEATLRDCIGEVVNVIAGQAKTLLFGTPRHFLLSTPTTGIADLPEPEAERWVLGFASELGEFSVYLRLPG